MKPTIIQAVPVVLAGVFLFAACFPVGDMQEESRVVEKGDAVTAEIILDMGTGQLHLQGGADNLLEAAFSYNVERWKPHIEYFVSGDRGRLTLNQGESSGIPVGKGRNRWDIYLTEEIPLDVRVDFGAGEGRLNLVGLDLRSLGVDMGVGDLKIDVTGPRQRDLRIDINGGVGSASLTLPRKIGVRARIDKGIGSVGAPGFVRRGEFYINPVYGKTDITIDITIDAGIGSIDLRLR